MFARIYKSIAQETEFELQSMKKETVGTAELLDQFYKVEVGDQPDAATNTQIFRVLFCRICLTLTTWGSRIQWST